MKYSFKRVFSIFLSIIVFSSMFQSLAMYQPADSDELIDSIIRNKTSKDDQNLIKQELNRSIDRGTGIVGGGIRIFEPYQFHSDEPRRVCVYTIPYVLDDRCPVLRELVNMLWSTVDAAKDLNKIDKSFINQTQRFLDNLNSTCKISASYLDLFGAIELYMERTAHPADKSNTKSAMKSVKERIITKWNEFNKPVVSENITAMNLLLKLYECIGNKKFLRSDSVSNYHNVLVIAYDTGVDNKNFFVRLFSGTRKTKKSCVDFISIDGLNKSTTYYKSSFEERFKYLYEQIEKEIRVFFDFISAQREKPIKTKIEIIECRLDKIENKLLTHEELLVIRNEQSQLGELAQALREMRNLIRNMIESEKVDAVERDRILERVNAVIEKQIPDEQQPTDEETAKLHNHMKEMKKAIVKNVEDIHALKKFVRELKTYDDETRCLHEELLKDREHWEKRAIEIEEFADSLKRDEQYLETISEGKVKSFVWQQYKQSGWYNKWRLRSMFPFIKELELNEKSKK